MPSVKVRDNEPFDVALRRFKRACEKAGVLSEARRREHYEKPTQVRKRKQAAAVKRQLKRTARDMSKTGTSRARAAAARNASPTATGPAGRGGPGGPRRHMSS